MLLVLPPRDAQTVMVTGATDGLGRAVATRLAQLGAAPARVAQVSSIGQAELDLDDLLSERDWDGVTAYRRAKLAMVMAATDLGAELAGSGVTVNALHPATLMDTTMVTASGAEPRSTLEEGVTATMRLALDPTLDDVTGGFFDGARQAPEATHPQARDAHVRAEVGRRSEELIATALARGAVPV